MKLQALKKYELYSIIREGAGQANFEYLLISDEE